MRYLFAGLPFFVWLDGSRAEEIGHSDKSTNREEAINSHQLVPNPDGSKLPQTITFFMPGKIAYASNGLIALRGTSSSGLAVTYKSENPEVLVITNQGAQYNAVIKGKGTTTITASHPGNSHYLPANDVVVTVEIK